MKSPSEAKFGLGLAALGRPDYINLGHGQDFAQSRSVEHLEQRTHTLLDAAWHAGIRYFDTARSYGLAEQFLSNWLADNESKTSGLMIGSKWGYTYAANWQKDAKVHEVKEHSLERLEKQWQESYELLGHHLDFYLVHSATMESGILENQVVLQKLATLKQQNIMVGLSVSGTEQAEILRRALALNIDGQRLFDVIQVTYNLLERSATQQLQQAHESGVLVVIKEGLANGRLTSRNTTDNDYLADIQQVAFTYNTSIDTLSLAAIAQQPFVDIVLSGASTLEQLNSNLKAQTLESNESLFDKLCEISQTPTAYWNARAKLHWN